MPTFFSRPTPCSSRQVVNQVGKLMKISKFNELLQRQHSYLTMCTKSRTGQGSIHNPLRCHRAKLHTNTKQPNKKQKQKHQQKQTQPKKTRPVISTSVHGQLKRIRRDEDIVSPLGLVWHVKKRAERNSAASHLEASPNDHQARHQTTNLSSTRYRLILAKASNLKASNLDWLTRDKRGCLYRICLSMR